MFVCLLLQPFPCYLFQEFHVEHVSSSSRSLLTRSCNKTCPSTCHWHRIPDFNRVLRCYLISLFHYLKYSHRPLTFLEWTFVEVLHTLYITNQSTSAWEALVKITCYINYLYMLICANGARTNIPYFTAKWSESHEDRFLSHGIILAWNESLLTYSPDNQLIACLKKREVEL